MQDLSQSWLRCVLETDDEVRQQGLDDDDFQALGERIAEQRSELGQVLARGLTHRIVPAMRTFFNLCGVEAKLSAEDERKASYAFLQAVVTALDYQARRHAGQVVKTDEVSVPAPSGNTWQHVFETWRDYVVNRPKTTTIACNTAWRQLEGFARSRDVLWPAHVTPKLMAALVEHMKAEGLAPKTINERLRKIRLVYKIAVGKEVLDKNPATLTLGIEVPKHMQGRAKRQPFSPKDLQTIFGSPIFTQQLRSRGQAGEASYWIPLIMYYSGARPEEIAGFTVDDIRHSKKLGWYFHITDLPSDDDGLFDDDDLLDDQGGEIPRGAEERRHLKNVASRRNVPIVRELVELGLLRYVKHLDEEGHSRMFPGLRPDSHGKLSGSHGKFFGRYKRAL